MDRKTTQNIMQLASWQPQQSADPWSFLTSYWGEWGNPTGMESMAWQWELLSNKNDWQILWSQSNKTDQKIQAHEEKLNSMLTWDEVVDSVIQTPQANWDAYQVAVANLNPDLKSANKKYQSTLNNLNVLQNERVNLSQASQIMMDAYRNAIRSTEDAAQNMMYANAANAAIQAGGAISATPWLASNPMAAAQTRMSAQNQAMLQNAQIRWNADQNIWNIYNSMAQMPSQLANIYQINNWVEQQWQQLAQQEALNNAQANYYNAQAQAAARQGSYSGWSWSYSGWSGTTSKWTGTTSGDWTSNWWDASLDYILSKYEVIKPDSSSSVYQLKDKSTWKVLSTEEAFWVNEKEFKNQVDLEELYLKQKWA